MGHRICRSLAHALALEPWSRKIIIIMDFTVRDQGHRCRSRRIRPCSARMPSNCDFWLLAAGEPLLCEERGRTPKLERLWVRKPETKGEVVRGAEDQAAVAVLGVRE
jgi:hypothetical protein